MKNLLIIIAILGLGVGIGWLVSDYHARQNARPCVMAEKRIVAKYESLEEPLKEFKMYFELAEYGCPENRREYVERFELEKRKFFGARAVGAEIRVDMEKVGRVVEEAVKPAVDAMLDAFDKMKDTKISITVE